MKMVKSIVLVSAGLAFAAFTGAAVAGKISSVKVEPASGTVGSQVKVTVEGENEGICALRVEYGNGDADVTKMNAGKDDFPRSFMKAYNAAGTYTITAKGGKEGSTFGCIGEAKATVTIAAAPKPVAAAAPAASAPAAPACPEGYNLNKKSVDKKSGAFTCAAAKGSKKPEKAIDCPSGTTYFTNTKGSTLGCKKAAVAKK